MKRKVELETGCYYHVFNKSIEGFRIFNNVQDFRRMIFLIRYYQIKDIPCSFAQFLLRDFVQEKGVEDSLLDMVSGEKKLVDIIAYCLMPTHIHFILKQTTDEGITTFMRLLQNSYASYLNRKIKRKGPLWTGRFKNVLVEDDDHLLHLTRYVHLNPTTAGLVDRPQDWPHSSYQEYLGPVPQERKIATCEDVIEMSSSDYKEFAEEWIKGQRELGFIKHLILE